MQTRTKSDEQKLRGRGSLRTGYGGCRAGKSALSHAIAHMGLRNPTPLSNQAGFLVGRDGLYAPHQGKSSPGGMGLNLPPCGIARKFGSSTSPRTWTCPEHPGSVPWWPDCRIDQRHALVRRRAHGLSDRHCPTPRWRSSPGPAFRLPS